MGLTLKIKGADYSANNLGTYYDVDALSYVNNTGISDILFVEACNDLVVGLKTNSIWTKIKAMWLFYGDTALQCKHDVKGNVAYTLAGLTDVPLNAGLDLSVLAVQSPKFIDTGFRGDAGLTANGHLALYNNTVEISAINIALHDTDGSVGFSGYGASRSIGGSGANSYVKLKAGNTDVAPTKNIETGLFLGTQIGAESKIYSRGLLHASANFASYGGTPSANLTIGSPSIYGSSMKLQMVSIGDGLDAAETLIYSNLMDAYITNINR